MSPLCPNIQIPQASDYLLKRKPTSSPPISPVVLESIEEVSKIFKPGATKTKRVRAERKEASFQELHQISGLILSPKNDDQQQLSRKAILSKRIAALNRAEREFTKRTKGVVLEPNGGSDIGGNFIASDLLFYSFSKKSGLVIKPGKKEIHEGLLAQAVLEIVGLEDTVPAMKAGEIDRVKSSRDLNVRYEILQNDVGQQYLVEKKWSIPIDGQNVVDGMAIYHKDSDARLSISKRENKIYVEKDNQDDDDDEDDTWDEFCNVPFVVMSSLDNSGYFLVPEDSSPITVGKSNTVERNGFPYELTLDLQIIGHQVPALFMEKVEDLWTGSNQSGSQSGSEEVDEDPGLDIEKKSDERDEFYRRIDGRSFVNSFVGYMLTRSSDGKIVTLKTDSNFLFQERFGKLQIKQIDLDGVMPLSNAPVNARTKHPLLCGLMGFPHVDDELLVQGWKGFSGVWGYLQELLMRCTAVDKEEAVLEAVARYSEEGCSLEEVQAKQRAYSEVMTRIRMFLQERQEGESVTLKGLFFYVFPEYGQHFEELLKGGVSPQRAALMVGREARER